MREKISRYACLLLLITSCQNIFAAPAERQSGQATTPDISLCPAKYETTKARVEPRAFPVENIGNTEISADFTETSTDGSTVLDGNIIIERHLMRVTADHADYSTKNDEIKFYKFVLMLRKRFINKMFTDLIKKEHISTKIFSLEDWNEISDVKSQ